MKVLSSGKKYASVLIAVISIFCAVLSYTHRKEGDRWIFYVYMDGRAYYSYLPAIFIYNDYTFSFYEQKTPHIGEKNFCLDYKGKKVNKYFIGVAILQAPFFFLAHGCSYLFNFPTDGYSQLYFMSVALAAVFYLWLGLFCLMKLLRLYGFSEIVISITMVVLVFGTNLYYYATHEPSMSHIYSFAFTSAFIYFAQQIFYSYKRKYVLLAAISLILAFLIRPLAGLIILLIVPFLLVFGNLNLKSFIQVLLRDKLTLLCVALIFVIPIGMQVLMWYKETGYFFVDSYAQEGFDWFSPHTIDSLFSYRKGWLLYNPVMLFSFFGLIVIYKKNRNAFYASLLFLSVMIYFLSAWHEWSYGYCYGLRAYIDYYPFISILFAFFLSGLNGKVIKAVVTCSFVILIVIQQIQTYQAEYCIIHPDKMNKSRYWSVFLRTEDGLINYFSLNPNDQVAPDKYKLQEWR